MELCRCEVHRGHYRVGQALHAEDRSRLLLGTGISGHLAWHLVWGPDGVYTGVGKVLREGNKLLHREVWARPGG